MKSHESDQVSLANVIYSDVFAKCAATPDLRDLKTFKSRVEQEGLSFLTITLPQFGKDFERSLADGHVAPTAFRSFGKVGRIPAFLQGIVGQVFDRETGGLLNEEQINIPAIEGIRQLAYAFKKMEMDCTLQRVQSTIDGFAQLERDLSLVRVPQELLDDFCQVADILWNGLSDINLRELVPRHGPGATAEGVSGNQKFSWRLWHDRLEPYFPFLDSAYSLGAYGSKEFEDVTIVQAEEEQPVKVTPVPKTMKGPRVIAIEPCCMQYVQQAIRRELYSRVERLPLSSGHVNFRDQGVNRALALTSSKDGLMATLDLSDASDRVINDVALHMFDCNPDLRDAVVACRSTHAKLPDGRVIGPLKKFASMGSALCFPVESMYFYTICVGTLLREQNLPVSFRNVYKVSREVYVYGDDIIVPVRWAATIAEDLQKYHCKVNMQKSFWTGRFRESCGMDAYGGVEVTPTYIRKLHPSNRQQGDVLISWVKTANLFAKRGYTATSSYMFSVCERHLGKLPYVSENSPSLGRIHDVGLHDGGRMSMLILELLSTKTGRWNADHQLFEVKSWVASPVRCTDALDGYGALMKFFLSEAFVRDNAIKAQDENHLERSARHGAVTLQRRWVPL